MFVQAHSGTAIPIDHVSCMYLLRDKGSCGVTHMVMTMNWSRSMTMSILIKTTGKYLAIDFLEIQQLK